MATLTCTSSLDSDGRMLSDKRDSSCSQLQLRWDHADLVSYYYYTGSLLSTVLEKLNYCTRPDNFYNTACVSSTDVRDTVDKCYYDIVNILVTCANKFVPVRRKCFYKFWWDEDLNSLKEAAIDSDYGRPQVNRDLAQFLLINKLVCTIVNASEMARG